MTSFDEPICTEHETVVIERGRESGATIIVAVHSTTLGPALGGSRLWRYPRWQDALDDALRLSRGMTSKNALAGLQRGGGKSVIMAPNEPLSGRFRERVFHDLGTVVESLGGSYITAEDVGTSALDMEAVATRTSHLVGLPAALGGRGDPGEFTARGVLGCLDALLPRIGVSRFGAARVSIAGLGQVGGRLARTLAARGATLTLSDVDPAKRALAAELGAAWCDPTQIHRVEADVFMPAGVGGMLTADVIGTLGAGAVLGPANNQLADEDSAARLAARGILYAPDYVVNAGGVIYLGHEGSTESAIDLVDGLGAQLEAVLDVAESEALNPSDAADRLVRRILGQEA